MTLRPWQNCRTSEFGVDYCTCYKSREVLNVHYASLEEVKVLEKSVLMMLLLSILKLLKLLEILSA